MRQLLTAFPVFSIPDADRVGDTYEAYPTEGDLERLKDSRGMFFLGDAHDPWPWLTQDSRPVRIWTCMWLSKHYVIPDRLCRLLI